VVSNGTPALITWGIDPSRFEQSLQLRRIGAFVADVPTMRVAGADRYDSQRRPMGNDACAQNCRNGRQDRSAQAVNNRCLERAPVWQFFPRYLACATANMARSISP